MKSISNSMTITQWEWSYDDKLMTGAVWDSLQCIWMGQAVTRAKSNVENGFYCIHSLFSHSCTPPLNPFTYPGQPPLQWRKALLPFNRFSLIYLLWCSRSSDIRHSVHTPQPCDTRPEARALPLEWWCCIRAVPLKEGRNIEKRERKNTGTALLQWQTSCCGDFPKTNVYVSVHFWYFIYAFAQIITQACSCGPHCYCCPSFHFDITSSLIVKPNTW